ncbi:MAG: 4-hydroxy-3-methylbut-2-enyl diphosphate reductase [Coriobacteriia bacterium]|nr:4-hydroxy-3-methylbut-2-enyl diphosphate reductase [Coriobacteriia bacterium]
MEICVAKNAGACYGVSRSLDIVKGSCNDSRKIATLGELIHNPLVVKELSEELGVSVVDSVKEAAEKGIEKLIIRSHGVPLEVLREAEESGIEIVDATCPYVKNVASSASLLAGLYPAVVIIGKHGHPEVGSVASYIRAAASEVYIGETVEEVDKFLPELKELNDSVGVVSQTTQSVEVFEDMVKYLKDSGVKVEVENTICVATKKRQESAAELAKQVDAMLVIGGHNSSNTNHLADLCKENCEKVFHIESVEELKGVDLSSVNKLGITAGASTPKSQIDKILDEIKTMS